MTEAEEAGLRELAAELASAANSPWEPMAIARMFARPKPGELCLTMQGWIDLDAGRSPLLQGMPPEEPADIELACEVFGVAMTELDPGDAALVANGMAEAVVEAFAMVQRMEPPSNQRAATGDDGFGTWLPILACLVEQLRMPLHTALSMKVGQAFALIAAARHNQGWKVVGKNYRLLEVNRSPEDRVDG